MRLLRDTDVISIMDRHTRDDGTLDEDISVILEEAKIAFDEEKVTEQLRDFSFDMSLDQPDCKAVWLDRAIAIVRKGGIEQ